MKGNEPAIGTWYSTLDEDKFLLGEDFNDLKSLGSDFLVAVLAMHFLTFKKRGSGWHIARYSRFLDARGVHGTQADHQIRGVS